MPDYHNENDVEPENYYDVEYADGVDEDGWAIMKAIYLEIRDDGTLYHENFGEFVDLEAFMTYALEKTKLDRSFYISEILLECDSAIITQNLDHLYHTALDNE